MSRSRAKEGVVCPAFQKPHGPPCDPGFDSFNIMGQEVERFFGKGTRKKGGLDTPKRAPWRSLITQFCGKECRDAGWFLCVARMVGVATRPPPQKVVMEEQACAQQPSSGWWTAWCWYVGGAQQEATRKANNRSSKEERHAVLARFLLFWSHSRTPAFESKCLSTDKMCNVRLCRYPTSFTSAQFPPTSIV